MNLKKAAFVTAIGYITLSIACDTYRIFRAVKARKAHQVEVVSGE